MKKLFQIMLVACLMVLGTQAAFANSDKATVQEGADLTAVRSMAVASPLYMQGDETAPDKAMLTKILYDASHVATKYTVVSYDTMARHLKDDKKIDLAGMGRHQAAKAFKDNLAGYADSYVVLTVANNSKVIFFFDVYKTGTNQLLFSYQIQANSSEKNTVVGYTTLCEQFYKHYERALTAQEKQTKKK